MQNTFHTDELAVTEKMGLTEDQVYDLVKDMFGEEGVKAARVFLRGTTAAIRFDGKEIVYFRDVNNLLNYLVFGSPLHPDHKG